MGTKNFVALATIPAGTPQQTESAAVDLYAVVPPNGFSPSGFSVILAGNFVGSIALVGSLDGVNYRPIAGFTAGARADMSSNNSLEFEPQLVANLVRYIKWRTQAVTTVLSAVKITLGGELNCDCAVSENGKVMVTGADTTSGFLGAKLVAGTNITLTVQNPGANENIKIDAAGGGGSSPPVFISPAQRAQDLANDLTSGIDATGGAKFQVGPSDLSCTGVLVRTDAFLAVNLKVTIWNAALASVATVTAATVPGLQTFTFGAPVVLDSTGIYYVSAYDTGAANKGFYIEDGNLPAFPAMAGSITFLALALEGAGDSAPTTVVAGQSAPVTPIFA